MFHFKRDVLERPQDFIARWRAQGIGKIPKRRYNFLNYFSMAFCTPGRPADPVTFTEIFSPDSDISHCIFPTIIILLMSFYFFCQEKSNIKLEKVKWQIKNFLFLIFTF